MPSTSSNSPSTFGQGSAFHLSLRVRDLAAAANFYQQMFGVEPEKAYADYVKFNVAEPPIVLTLEVAEEGQGPRLDHMGIRVADRKDLMLAATELNDRDVKVEFLDNVACCYARQTKVYLHDPDGRLFEVYTVEADIAPDADKAARPSPASSPSAAGNDYIHYIPNPLQIPSLPGSVASIQLLGTFNRKEFGAKIFEVFAACRKALIPGGKLTLHLLAANKEFAGEVPRLPEPANHVNHLPKDSALVNALEECGFQAINLKRFSHGSVFTIGDVECREFLVEAINPVTQTQEQNRQTVVFKGPMPQIVSDSGQIYRRGQRTEISNSELAYLKASGFVDFFTLLNDSRGCHAN